MNPPSSSDFQIRMERIFEEAESASRMSVEINSGELHREVGGYPGSNHRMPLCCHIMRKNMLPGDVVLQEPPSGQGASVVIRYRLPR